MRCFVTGASGFLGSHLVRQLLVNGHSVIVLMRQVSRSRRTIDWLDHVEIVNGTLEQVDILRQQLVRQTADVFFHLAWCGVTAERRYDPAQILTNVVSSLQLWQLARDLGCGHWIGLGSQAEYGPSMDVLREDFAPCPVTAYGVAKLTTGILTAKMSELSGMRHTWVRLFSAYGPGDDPRHMIPSVIRSLCDGKKPALTKGEQQWDYLYVEDAARALCRIAETGATGTLNLSSGQSVALRRVVEQLRDLIDPRLPLGFGEVPYSQDQVMHLEADISSLQTTTGWQPQVSLQEGLKRTVGWYRDHQP